MALTAKDAPGEGVSGPFSCCVPHQHTGSVRPGSCMWERMAHAGPHQPCLGCRAMRVDQVSWATSLWGRAVLFAPLLACCPLPGRQRGLGRNWVLGGDLYWEVAEQEVCGGQCSWRTALGMGSAAP